MTISRQRQTNYLCSSVIQWKSEIRRAAYIITEFENVTFKWQILRQISQS